ncbi:MAG: hypothetical protein ACI4JW_08950 [Oscillospiraceae bacterium]
MENTQNITKQKNPKLNNKRLRTAAIILTALLAIAIPVAAWFSNQRGMVTLTKIQSPAALSIGAGNKESCAYIDMSGIDVSDKNVTSKEFVFSVYSSVLGNYKIQLAHTTNIPFTYEIYKASACDENGESVENAVVYHSKLDSKDYYYTKGEKITGDYINKQDAVLLADSTQHEATYGEYNNVQKNAEPLYWQNDTAIKAVQNDGEGFVDYYVLKVSWVNGTVKNDKETDMVYITAGMV